jgi:general secretion pathway protein I
MSASGADHTEAGFTLLEFLVAFAVLTLFLGVGLAGTAVAMRGDGQANFLTRATVIARNKLAAAGVDFPLRPGRAGGALPNGYVWAADMRRYGPEGKGLAMRGYWVEVTVADPRNNGGRKVSLTTVALAPEVAP